MKRVVYLHGLNSSHRSFSYITQKLPTHDHVLLDYYSHGPLADSIEQVRKALPKGDLILVGHSLGGVIATILASEEARVKGLVTISSPLNGSRAAATLRWMPGSSAVIGDIVHRGPYAMRCTEMKLTIPTLSIISTGGHLPTSPEPNDSVVSIESQRALRFGRKVEIKANHFEVLMHERTAKLLNDFLKENGPLHEDHIEDRSAATTSPTGEL